MHVWGFSSAQEWEMWKTVMWRVHVHVPSVSVLNKSERWYFYYYTLLYMFMTEVTVGVGALYQGVVLFWAPNKFRYSANVVLHNTKDKGKQRNVRNYCVLNYTDNHECRKYRFAEIKALWSNRNNSLVILEKKVHPQRKSSHLIRRHDVILYNDATSCTCL